MATPTRSQIDSCSTRAKRGESSPGAGVLNRRLAVALPLKNIGLPTRPHKPHYTRPGGSQVGGRCRTSAVVPTRCLPCNTRGAGAFEAKGVIPRWAKLAPPFHRKKNPDVDEACPPH